MKENNKEAEQQCDIHNVSGSPMEFYDDLMKLINSYRAKGLRKPDLIAKMEYATESCYT